MRLISQRKRIYMLTAVAFTLFQGGWGSLEIYQGFLKEKISNGRKASLKGRFTVTTHFSLLTYNQRRVLGALSGVLFRAKSYPSPWCSCSRKKHTLSSRREDQTNLEGKGELFLLTLYNLPAPQWVSSDLYQLFS